MTTANVAITEGSGKYAATYSVSEDAITKQLQRMVVNDSSGAEIGTGYNASANFTSGTTAYAANDVCGGALTFASIGPSAGRVMITSVALRIDSSAVISGQTSYTLHLYDVTPPSAVADSGAWDLPSGDRAAYLGSIDLGTPVDLGSTLYIGRDGVNKQIKLAGTSVFAYLVSTGAYTPTAQVYTVQLHSVPT
jgi:hypothetical protein